MKYIPDYMKFINERVNLKASHLSSAQYQKAKKLKAFSSDDWVWNSDTSLYDRVDESAIDEAAKIETERYVRSHGKKPKGYGGWMFSYNRDGSDIWEIPNGMSWPDAQKWAKKKAKEDGEDYVYVMENVSNFITESAMSELDLLAKEAKDFKTFTKEVFKEFKNLPEKPDTIKWLDLIYKTAITEAKKI